MSLWEALQQVANVGEAFREAVMDPGALASAPFGATRPHTTLQLAADRLGESHVGVTMDAHGHYRCPLADLQGLAQPALEVGGIQVDLGVAAP